MMRLSAAHSASTFFRRSSKSPLYLVSATSDARLRLTTRQPLRRGGTLPAANRSARPSTSAVLPTPGSATAQAKQQGEAGRRKKEKGRNKRQSQVR